MALMAKSSIITTILLLFISTTNASKEVTGSYNWEASYSSPVPTTTTTYYYNPYEPTASPPPPPTQYYNYNPYQPTPSPPPPPPSPSPQYHRPTPSNSEQYQFMAPQNAARRSLGLSPLRWDDTLAAYAQGWANQRRYDCAMIHSDTSYGENIFWGSGPSYSARDAVQSWVDEGRWYDYNSNSCNYGQDCGHYTQIVWSTSTKIGCARVVCDNNGGVFVTCNYDPPGNIIGGRPY